MDKAVKTTGPVIDKTKMDEAVKTTGMVIDGQIDKAENCPRQNQAKPHGLGPSCSEPDIDGREDNKPMRPPPNDVTRDSTQLSGPVGNKGSSSSGIECSSADKDESSARGDDGGLSMTEEAIAKIWEQGPPGNNNGAWAYYYF